MDTAILACRCVDSKPPSSIEALQFSPDGRWLAVGRSSGVVEVFSSVSRHFKLRLEASSCTSVRKIVWLPLTVTAVKAAAHVETDGLPTEGETDCRTCVSLFEWRLVTAGLHGVITSWNLRTCRVQAECPSYGGAIFSLCRAPPESNRPAFAVACDDGRARIFQLSGPADQARREVDGQICEETLGSASAEEIRLVHTLPKAKTRLLSVCWYSPDLVFAGNAASCILRFSRNQQTFVADGKMMLESQPTAGGESPSTLVWNLCSLPRRSLLVSGDSRGCVTLWSLPACVALRSLQVHVADVLDMEVMVCQDSFLGAKSYSWASAAKMQQEVILSAGVDGKLSAITCTEEDGWVVRACRFPHLCDTQALACLPRIPGGQDASLVVTGAGDGSIKCMQQLTELAGLKAPCVSFCASPALRGLQKPRVLWKKRLIVCPSEDDVGIWHIEDGALEGKAVASKDTPAPLVKLARISLQGGAKCKCCDVTRDGHLVAVGSSAGLHLFGFHLKELEIQDLECIGSCCISETVTALRFVSRTVLACCHFSKKVPSTANHRRLRSLAEKTPESAGHGSPSASDKKTSKRARSHGGVEESSDSRRWVYTDIPSVREAEALPDHLRKDDGCYCLSFIKVSTGQELASLRGLPFPLVVMTPSSDFKKLACLNSNGSIMVVETKSHQPTHFFPNVFRRGESVASFCFSPDCTRLFVLGTRNGYFIADVDRPTGAVKEGCIPDHEPGDCAGQNAAACPRKRQRRGTRRIVGSIPTRQLPRGDGCVVDCKWVQAPNNESYVLCLMPSCLYKIPIVEPSEGLDGDKKSQKTEKRDIRLLDVSSASEGERNERASMQELPFTGCLKKSSFRKPVVIGPLPVHATAVCVPRVLPSSLFTNDQSNRSTRWTFVAQCLSPSSTRSTATTPGDSPVSDGRGGGSEKCLSKIVPNNATRALRQSVSKGFIGFAFESCAQLAAPAGLQGGPEHVLVLLETQNCRSLKEPSLPRFNRKRYGT